MYNSVFFFLGLTLLFVRIAPCRVFMITAMGTVMGIIMMVARISSWRCMMDFARNIGDRHPGLFYVVRHFVQTGIDYVWGYLYYESESNLRQHVDVENRDVIDQAINDGKGVIVISAHYGPMITTFMLQTMYGNIKRPVTADNFQRWEKMSTYTIKPFRSKMHEFLSNPALSIVSGRSERDMVKHLKQGGALLMYLDWPGPVKGNAVDFFGFRFSPNHFPFKMSLLTNSPVVFCSLEKKIGEGYLLRITQCDNFSSPHEGYMLYLSFLKALISANPFSWLLLPSLCRKKARSIVGQ